LLDGEGGHLCMDGRKQDGGCPDRQHAHHLLKLLDVGPRA
jgi:hypothetical protein